jgi:hypothetical protein
MNLEEIRQVLTSLDTIEAALIQAENKADYLVRELEALRDVQRSAQYLVDIIHTQGAGTSGGPFQVAYDNLREALKSYYQPNGPSTPQPH